MAGAPLNDPLDHSINQSVGMVNRSDKLTSVIARHNHSTNGLGARFGGDNTERILALLTGISPKLSRVGSNYPKSC